MGAHLIALERRQMRSKQGEFLLDRNVLDPLIIKRMYGCDVHL